MNDKFRAAYNEIFDRVRFYLLKPFFIPYINIFWLKSGNKNINRGKCSFNLVSDVNIMRIKRKSGLPVVGCSCWASTEIRTLDFVKVTY